MMESAEYKKLFAILAMVSLVWSLAARVFGPSDMYDQTQPKTVSYTTDIVANGRWILPIERGEYPATKPPLYNWIAAPFVSLLGYQNELAHKIPSVIALAVCWLAVVRLGRSIGRRSSGESDVDGEAIGWLAGILLPANYAMFKLGYLARPDMLLVLWTTIGWMACTALFAAHVDDDRKLSTSRKWLLVVGFWSCFALGGLTKGPAALVLPVYAVLAARFITGRFRTLNALQWWWGLPASLAVVGAWIFAAWQIHPAHVYDQLWYAELYGRVTGEGPEGSGQGWWGIVKTAPLPLFYFLSRFTPWSLFTILAFVVLLRRDRSTLQAHWRSVSVSHRPWVVGCMTMIGTTIGLYVFSASVRADYIAPAVPPACLLSAWWIITHTQTASRRLRASSVLILTILTLTALTIANIMQPAAPLRTFGRDINAFIEHAAGEIDNHSAPVVFWRAGPSHLQAMLGQSSTDNTQTLDEQISGGKPFWVVGGTRKNAPAIFPQWMDERDRNVVKITERQRSAELPRAFGWPVQVALYWVEPQSDE